MSSEEMIYVGAEERDPDDRTRRFLGKALESLQQSRVLLVGAGAVGNEVAKNLVMLGVRKIIVVDFDQVTASNLNRCIFFRPEDHQQTLKVHAIARGIRQLFPQAEIETHALPIQEAPDAVWDVPLVISAVDDSEARHFINMRLLSLETVPFLINGAMGRTFVETRVLLPGTTACLVCSWTAEYTRQLFARMARESCDAFFYRSVTRFPAISVLTSILGGIMATEATKILAGMELWRKEGAWFEELTPALGSAIRYDIRNHEFSVGQVYRNSACVEIFCRQRH